MSFEKLGKINAIGKASMFVAVFFASLHLLFLPTIPQVFASTNTPVHHDFPADHSDDNKHSVCPTEIHQFTQKDSGQQDMPCAPTPTTVSHLSQNTLHKTILLPIHTLGFAPPPASQKTVLLI